MMYVGNDSDVVDVTWLLYRPAKMNRQGQFVENDEVKTSLSDPLIVSMTCFLYAKYCPKSFVNQNHAFSVLHCLGTMH